jgi:hypothetical protein
MQQYRVPVTDLDATSYNSPSTLHFRSQHHPRHHVVPPNRPHPRVLHHSHLRGRPHNPGRGDYHPPVSRQTHHHHQRVDPIHLRNARQIHAILQVSIVDECVLACVLEPRKLCVSLLQHLLLAVVVLVVLSTTFDLMHVNFIITFFFVSDFIFFIHWLILVISDSVDLNGDGE